MHVYCAEKFHVSCYLKDVVSCNFTYWHSFGPVQKPFLESHPDKQMAENIKNNRTCNIDDLLPDEISLFYCGRQLIHRNVI